MSCTCWTARPAAAGTGTGTGQALDAASNRIHARSSHLAHQPSVVIASERMDDDPGWRLLDPGELLHVSSDAGDQEQRAVPGPARSPAEPLRP